MYRITLALHTSDSGPLICKKKLVNSVEVFKLCVLDSLVSWLFLSPSLSHRFGEEVLIFCLRVLPLRCLFVKVNLMHNLAKGVPVIKHQDQICESCMVGKQMKKSFSKKATYRASNILEMVHGDIYRLPSAQAGNSYILVLIDDCSSPIHLFEILVHVANSECEDDEYESDVTPIPEPRNYNEANLKPQWLESMKTELDYIVKNNTWKLFSLPKGVLPISDSRHNVDIDDVQSTIGQVFYLCTSTITWYSQKQTTLALSSCEAEFMAARVKQFVLRSY
ncbi:zinc finger, CCHC-type containing protein [Tanacetum coccineum]